jgi:hypothetical protein
VLQSSVYGLLRSYFLFFSQFIYFILVWNP